MIVGPTSKTLSRLIFVAAASLISFALTATANFSGVSVTAASSAPSAAEASRVLTSSSSALFPPSILSLKPPSKICTNDISCNSSLKMNIFSRKSHLASSPASAASLISRRVTAKMQLLAWISPSSPHDHHSGPFRYTSSIIIDNIINTYSKNSNHFHQAKTSSKTIAATSQSRRYHSATSRTAGATFHSTYFNSQLSKLSQSSSCRRRNHVSTTDLFLHSSNDCEQQRQQHKQYSLNEEAEQRIRAKHWFTKQLPEGYCIGICLSDEDGDTTTKTSGTPAEPTTAILNELIHPDEYSWGRANIQSQGSRTSYYLGRMALRSALRELLENNSQEREEERKKQRGEKGKQRNEQKHTSSTLWSQIQSSPIMKDGFGRPILPDIVVGSISHKGDCAVGLAQFQSTNNYLYDSSVDSMKRNNDSLGEVVWKEECPIVTDQELEDTSIENERLSSQFTSNSYTGTPRAKSPLVRGIGIDLERIDEKRGERIQRKILTGREQKELGGLEEIGISKGEEVILRFSLKESVYKAMHPILCEYVGFQEAEITPLSNGTADVKLDLVSQSHTNLGLVVRSTSWAKIEGFFLTSCSVGLISDLE